MLTVVLVMALGVGACRLSLVGGVSSGPIELRITESHVNLEWEHSLARVTREGSDIARFVLYLREFERHEQRKIAEVPAGGTPRFLIGVDSVLGSKDTGRYEFGVASVAASGNVSRIHWSTDFDAWPHGGWYVVWNRP